MKKERNIISIIFLIVVFSLISLASANTIHIKTVPNGKAHIFVLDPGEAYLLLNSYHVQSEISGEVSANYNNGNGELVDILVQITQNSKNIMSERFNDVATSSDVYLRVIPGDVSDNYKAEEEAAAAKIAAEEEAKKKAEEEAAKIAAEEAAKIAAEEEAKKKAEEEANSNILTGLATAFSSLTEKINLTYVFAVIIGFVVIGSILFFVIRIKKDSVPEYVPKKGGKASKETWQIIGRPYEKRLEEAEKEIKKATDELNNLRKLDKVEQAKRDVEMARQRLLKLQKGE